jgi:hypothetical protein
MSDMESPLSNKATDVNEVPTSYNTNVSYRNHTPGGLLSRIIDFNHFAACGNWLLSISIDQISFCRLLSIIKHNIVFCCGFARGCHGGLSYDGRVSGGKQFLYMVSELLTGRLYGSMIHWPLPLLDYRGFVATEKKSYRRWWVRRYLLKSGRGLF